jgi:hypothetical protein
MKLLPEKTSLFVETIDDIHLLPQGVYACYFCGTVVEWAKHSEIHKGLKEKLWALSDSGNAILVQEKLDNDRYAYLIKKTLEPLKPAIVKGLDTQTIRNKKYFA